MSFATEKRAAITIGNFDGVHRGHQEILKKVVEEAQKRSLESIALTFNPSPREFFTGAIGLRICSPDEKVELLRSLGIDRVIVLEFNKDLASQEAEDFVEEVLRGQLKAEKVYIGYDFRFGRGRRGDFDLLKKLGKKLSFEVERVDALLQEGEAISSTRVRRALEDGRVRWAGELLGRPYSICSEVVAGDRRGRELGFPTANLAQDEKVMPKDGVYFGKAKWQGSDSWKPALVSVGIRKTYYKEGNRLIEVHIMDQVGLDLYGRALTVKFLKWHRGELEFSGSDELIYAMKQDLNAGKAFFNAE